MKNFTAEQVFNNLKYGIGKSISYYPKVVNVINCNGNENEWCDHIIKINLKIVPSEFKKGTNIIFFLSINNLRVKSKYNRI